MNARLSFREMALHSAPKCPPEELFAPCVETGISNPSNVAVVSSDGTFTVPPITLMKKERPRHAYARINKASRGLSHGEGGVFFQGEVFFAIVYERLSTTASGYNLFRSPSSEKAQYVAIKKINKKQLDYYLKNGGLENPYKEIARMQELGDNTHVLACVEALEDDTFLYIITPMACSEGTLADHVLSMSSTMSTDRVRQIFKQIVDILSYLEAHNISHRDLSPDNFLFLTPNNLVVFDLALSVRNPTDEEGRRVLTTPQGTFGTLPFMPAEVFCNRIHDGLGVDLWSAGVLLYFMLTGRLLYMMPHPSDLNFCASILARDITGSNLQICTDGEETKVVAHDVDQKDHSIDPAALELLQHMLEPAPWDRWSLAQVIESDFVQGRCSTAESCLDAYSAGDDGNVRDMEIAVFTAQSLLMETFTS